MPTDVVSLIHDLGQFGGLGIVVAFLIWKDVRSDKIREKMETDHRAELQLMEQRRLDYDRDRLNTDKEQVATLSALASAIQGRIK